MNHEKLINICNKVTSDVVKDAYEADGKEFNGRNVGTYFGAHGAAISALAFVLKELIENDKSKQVSLKNT